MIFGIRAAERMSGVQGKMFEWGLMTSPRKTIHVILPQTLKCIQFFKHRSLYNLYTCFTSSFWGPFIGWGPGQIAPPPCPPPLPPPLGGPVRYFLGGKVCFRALINIPFIFIHILKILIKTSVCAKIGSHQNLARVL